MRKRLLRATFLASWVLLICSTVTTAQTRYWIGGTGDWNDTGHWSGTSGGGSGIGIPTAGDAVVFDASSFTATGQIVTVTAGATCASLDWTGVTNSPTLAIDNALSIAGGGATFVDAMFVTGTGGLSFTSTSNVTVNFGSTAKTFGNISFPATVARTITLNTPAAATLTMGVLSLGNNATLVITGAGSKVYGGTSFGTATRVGNLTNSTFNGTNTFAFDARGGFLNSTINGPLTTNSTISPLDFTNCTINNTFSFNGVVGFRNVTLTASATVNSNSGTLGVYSPCNFALGSVVNIAGGTTYLVNSTGNTFNNTLTAGNNAILTFNNINTFGGFINLGAGNNVTATFSGTGNNVFNGGITTGTNNNITFSNSGTNSYQNVTLGAGTTWRFGTGGASTTAAFTANGTCASPVNLNSNTGATQATVTFGSFPNTTNVNISNINNAGAALNILAGTGSNNANITLPSAGRTLYWVGNSGSWNSPTNWSTTSGGTANACMPTALDNVVFDANSFSTTGHTVTVTSGAACKDMTWSIGTDNPVLALSNELTVHGTTLTLDNTMTVSGASRITLANTGNINVATGTGAKTITGGFNFTGTAARTITLGTSAAGTNTFGPLTVGSNSTLNITGASAKTFTNVNMGTVAGTWAGSYTITNMNVGGTLAGGLNLPGATFTASGTSNLAGQYAFSGNLSLGTSASMTINGQLTASGNTTLADGATLSLAGTGPNSFVNVTLNSSVTATTTSLLLAPGVTNTLSGTLTADASCGVVLLGSSGAAATLSLSSNQTETGTTVRNINRTGSTLTINNGLDGGGNTGVAFASPAAASRTLYWVGGSGNWNDPNRWSTVSGGAGGNCPPTLADDVFFDVGSGFAGTIKTVTVNVDAFCRSMSWAGAANTPVFAGVAARTLTLAGNLTLISGMTHSFAGKYAFVSSVTGRTINTAGLTLADVDFAGVGGGWQLATSGLTVTNALTVLAGAFNANNLAITAGSILAGNPSDLPRSLLLGTGSHTVTGTGTVVDLTGSNLTFTPGASGQITFNNANAVTVETGATTKTLPNLIFSNSSASAITLNTGSGTNRITFRDITLTNLNNRTFTINGTSPKTYGTVSIDGNGATVTINGSNSASPGNNVFGSLTFVDSRTGTNATINGNNTFSGAVNIHGGGGSANSVNFTGTNTFSGAFTARQGSTGGTELQFASAGGTNTTTFGGAVSLNPGNVTSVDVNFTNATTFNAGANLTIGENTTTRFMGTGNNAFQNVTVNASSIFSLQNVGTASFTAATINSNTGLGVTWEFGAGRVASFTGSLAINAQCNSPVYVKSTQAGSQANVSFGAAQFWNNQVIVNDLNVTAGPVTAYATSGAPGNNVNVTYPGTVDNRTLYWVGGSGIWNTTNAANWSTTSGGAGGSCPPTANDDVFFDAASGLAGGTVTVNTSQIYCRNMDWTGTPANTTFALGANVLEINGSLTLAPGLTITPSTAPPSLPSFGISEFRFTNSSDANPTTIGVTTRTITTLAGTTAALPNVYFDQNGTSTTWRLDGPAAFRATYRLGLQAGTLNTNGITVHCNNLTTNDSGDQLRTLTLGNSTVYINGSEATGIYEVLDLRGNNLTLSMPGATSKFQFTNSDQWLGIFVGGPLKELPDLLFQSNPYSLSAGPRDIDVHTGDEAARITFRNIEITRNSDNTQMVVYGSSPKTYGDITLPNNFNLNDIGQRTFYGTNNAPPDNNIYRGRITAGNNASIRFEGNNTFQSTLNFNPGAGFNGGVIFQNVNTFQDDVTIAGTWDVNNAVQFGNGGTTTFAAGAVLDIASNNTTRLTPTVTFGGVGSAGVGAGVVGNSTVFNVNATLRSAAGTNNSIYRFSGPVTQAAGTTLTVAQETIGLFVGDNTLMATPEDHPPVGAATVFNMAGNFVVGAQSRVKFANNGNNLYNTVTIGDYSTFEFTSFNTSNVSGAFNAVGSCNVWKRIAAHISGDQANVTFAANQSWQYVIVQDINETAGGGAVTAANSTNVGLPGPSSNTNVTFSSGIPTPGTLVWVGGHSSNNSGDNLWSNPKNWVQMPASNNPAHITAAQRANGGSCIPSSENDVLFTGISFSGSASPSGKYNTVTVDIPEAFCRTMTWDNNVQNGAILTGDDPLNILRVHGDITMGKDVDNQFNGTFSFQSSTGTRTIDMNGPSASPASTDVESFRGPVQINNVGAVYELASDIVIDAVDQGGQRWGNFTVIHGQLSGRVRDITLNGNWQVKAPATGNPQGVFLHNNGGTVTFNGQNAVNGTQNVVGGTSPFYNLVINRQSNPAATDITGDDANIPNQARSWVVIQNKNDVVSLTNLPSNNNADAGGNPGTAANRGSWNNGITVDRNLTITRGGLYDNGYQIRGNNAGDLTMGADAVLSIGHANASVGLSNNAILGSRFPTGFNRSKITLAPSSVVSYSANGNQDISSEPLYGNLYLRNANPGTTTGLFTLTSTATRKRLSLGSNAQALTINGWFTVERGILFHDMGSQVAIGAGVGMTMQEGGTMVIGSGAQTVATITGTGSDPANNLTGNTTLTANATTFPAFTQANIYMDQNSNVVYASSLPQVVRGNLNATGTTGQRYGNLVLVNPATSSPTLREKVVEATGAIKVNGLIIHPNANLVDNGQQINGTSGAPFVMSAATTGTTFVDPLALPFNGQAPTSTGTTSGATPINTSYRARDFDFGFRFHGFITIPSAGTYTFYTSSDDGSMLQVNGTVVVNNNFDQGTTTRSGTIALAAGTYPITVTYHQGGGGFALTAEWQCASCGPAVARAQIPSSVLRTTQAGPTGALNYSYYEAPGGVNYNVWSGNSAGISSTASGNGGIRAYPDFTHPSAASTATFAGESRLVIGTGTVSTVFPANFADAGLDFDLGTRIVYNAGLAQTVRGLGSTTANQQYANLTLTNPVSASPRVVSKTLDNLAATAVTIRQALTINPNNNFIDNGRQINGTAGQVFRMNNVTLATNAVTNTGTVGDAGESRITIGTATVGTSFPANYSETNGVDINFEENTTVVYNSNVNQNVAGIMSATVTGRYANLMLTNAQASPSTLVVKTLINRPITIRNNFTINPNNVFLDNNYQVTGTSGQRFSMFNTTLPTIPETGVVVGSAGESRYVAASDGSSSRSTLTTTFPGGYRTGATLVTDSDIDFEPNTTFAYSASHASQNVQGLGGTGRTTYANLWLVNRASSSPVLRDKILVGQGTKVRNTLTIGPNNNFIDNGFQITGDAAGQLNMFNATLAPNANNGNVMNGTVGSTIGAAGESRLTLGTAATATTFPGLYALQNSANLLLQLNTTVVYNAGQAQPVAGIYHATANSNANYAQLSFVNAGTGTIIKTLTNQARVRQNLTIGGLTAGTPSGADNRLDASATNYKIFLQGDWFTHAGDGFNARAGEVELEGSVTQDIRTRNTSDFTPEAGTQDFWNLRINNSRAVPNIAIDLDSRVAVGNQMIFVQGLVGSSNLSGATLTTSPSDDMLIFRHNATVSGATDNSFVLGAVRKVGQVASGIFHFPIGVVNGGAGFYRPSGVSAMSSATGAFISQYYLQAPLSANFPTRIENIQTNVVGSAQPLVNVSGREFWMVNRENDATATAFVSLTWREPQSGGVGVGIVDPNRYQGLRVARWDGLLGANQWRNHGGTSFANYPSGAAVGNTIGTLTSQYNGAGAAGAVGSFSPFTLASEITFNPLPVTLVDFRAAAADRQVNLNWQTSSEVNTSHFVVERSRDGKTFEPVTQVAAKGNSAALLLYKATDAAPFTGLSYYRLRIVDLDGTFAYSKVVRVVLGVAGGLGEVVLFPNPTAGRNINLKLTDPEARVLGVHDLLGRQVGHRTARNADGTLAVDFPEPLAKGAYVATVASGDGLQTVRIRFVVQ